MENPGGFFVRRVLGLSLFSFFRSFAMLYGSFNVSLEKRVAEARIEVNSGWNCTAKKNG